MFVCVCLCAENDRKKTPIYYRLKTTTTTHTTIYNICRIACKLKISFWNISLDVFLFTCSFSFKNMMLAFCLSLLYQYNLYTLFENFVFVQDITRKNFTQPSSSTKSNCIFLSFSSCFLLFLSFNAISLFDIQFRIPKNSVIFCIRPIRIPSSCSLSLLHSRSFALPLSHTVSNVIFLFLSCFFFVTRISRYILCSYLHLLFAWFYILFPFAFYVMFKKIFQNLFINIFMKFNRS